MSEEDLRVLATANPDAFRKVKNAMDTIRVKQSRDDPNAFAAYILRDEQTGKPIKQAPYHKKVQDIASKDSRAVIWGHVGMGKCVTSGTIFTLDSGEPVDLTTLRSLRSAGPVRVLSLDTTTGQPYWAPVKSIDYDGKVPCITVETDLGNVTTISANHPFYVRRGPREGWVEARNLLEGDAVYGPSSYTAPQRAWFPKEDAATIGLLLNLIASSASLEEQDKEQKPEGVKFIIPKKLTDPLADSILYMLRQMCEARGWNLSAEQVDLGYLCKIPEVGKFLRSYGYTFDYEFRVYRWMPRVVSNDPMGFPGAIFASGDEVLWTLIDHLLVGRLRLNHGVLGSFEGWSCKFIDRGCRFVLTRLGLAHKRHRSTKTPWTRLLGKSVSDAFERLKKVAHPYYKLLDRVLLPYQDLGGHSGPYDKRVWVETRIRRITPAGLRETFAVEIDDPRHTHVTDGILTHNTQQLSIARVLWEIGRNPNIRVVIVQATIGLAEGIVTSLKNHIENNPRVHKVFPNLKPGEEWTTSQFSVDRPGNLKDPTVTAVGSEGNILGRRIDLLILDDALTLENTRLEGRRASFLRWLQSTLFTRLEPGSRVIFIGNAWDPQDAMHYYSKIETWNAYRFPVRDQKTKEPLWPERWPRDRIEAFVKENPLEAARALDCNAESDQGSRFKEAAIIAAIDAGRGIFGPKNRIESRDEIPADWITATGVDLGLKREVGADYTSFVHWALTPAGKKVVLAVDRGRYDYDEIISLVIDAHMRYGSMVYVESVQAQRWIVDAVQKQCPGIPVAYFFTSGRGGFQNKHSSTFGIEAVAKDFVKNVITLLASEGSASGTTDGVCPNVSNLIFEARSYTAGPGHHSGDSLMAAWIGHQALNRAAGLISSVEIDARIQPDGSYGYDQEMAGALDRLNPGKRGDQPSLEEIKKMAFKEMFQDVLGNLGDY